MSARAFREARELLLRHRTDPLAAKERFRWPELTEFNWALDWFDVHARGNERAALWIVGEDGETEAELGFAELAARSDRAANFLRGLGVRRGDRILVMLPNVVPLWEVMLAAMKLGAVVVPATTLLSREDLADRIARGAVKHVVTELAHAPRLDGVADGVTRIVTDAARSDADAGAGAAAGVGGGRAPTGWHSWADVAHAEPGFEPDGPTRASDPLLLYFTSGTTSQPKLVLHTHASYPVGHLSTMYWLGLQEGAIHLNISSPGWAKHAWSCFFAPWNAGATVFIHRTERFDAVKTLEVLAKCRVTSLCAPPTVWRMLIQHDPGSYDVALTELASAGEPLNPKVIDALRDAWGLEPRDGYGQTETTALVGNPPGQPVRVGSMGRPLPGYDVVLVDAEGDEVQDEGEIALRLSPAPLGLMAGYADDPGRSEAALGGAHYRTGDVASRDADGWLTYVGRADDVFKSADYRISPFELESFIIRHDAVAEAAVVPSPHATKLSVPKAFLVLKAGRSPSAELAEDIFRYIRDRLSPYKRIRRIEFAELPKTISGKIRRVELREGEAASSAPEAKRGRVEFWEEDFPGLREDS